MPSLKDIKRRIKSTKNTQQITKAMKMVSAAKLKRAQDEITAARPYAEKIQELTLSLAAKTSPESHPLLSGAGGTKIGLILMTSDRGLCGGFNTVLLRTADRFIESRGDAQTTPAISLYLIGRRAMEHFKRRQYILLKSKNAGTGRPNYSAATETAKELIGLYLNGELDEVHLVYSEFKSALTQRPVVHKVLPISAEKTAGKNDTEPEDVEAIFEPSRDAVLKSLLPKYVETQIFRAMLESSASEHGARMTAMDSASRNAKEMIGGLTLKYNRLRQAAITKELMEIVGGAEALKG
ncbi:MAG: ATP synthase F1 subunit gamma [Deltaproteobacteria bacterium]|nr:ATP synthase F1 subunit gamma [Deltaproteobacteria bacterium]